MLYNQVPTFLSSQLSYEAISRKLEYMIAIPIDALLLPLGKIVLIIFLTYFSLRLVGKVVDKIFSISAIDTNKGLTLNRLIKSVARYAIYFISFLTILINIGLDPTPVLAGAGILGLAIGFGAQNLVRDIISGFFLIFENQMEVGNYVEVNGKIRGTVEEIGLRITKIREWNQRLHYLSNGEITQVTNYSRNQMRPLVSITVPYEADLRRTEKILEKVCQEIGQQYASELLEKPSVYGITSIENGGVQFTVMALSIPESYWLIERVLRRAIISAFDKNGIEIAYPRRVLQPSESLASLLIENYKN
mgnify:CR=1 FL=1